MRLPSYTLPYTRTNLPKHCARLKYASERNPARGPPLLTGATTAAILTGSKRRLWNDGRSGRPLRRLYGASRRRRAHEARTGAGRVAARGLRQGVWLLLV